MLTEASPHCPGSGFPSSCGGSPDVCPSDDAPASAGGPFDSGGSTAEGGSPPEDGGATTVTVQLLLFPPAFAVIVTVPGAIAVTLPF